MSIVNHFQFVRIESLTEDEGLVKKVIQEGSGECPKKGYVVTGTN